MKRLTVIICVMIIFLGGCTTGSPDTGPDQTGQSIPVETENQLLPPGEQAFDASFDQAYKEFKDAVSGKDLSVINNYLDDETRASFGSDQGRDYFYKFWGLNQNPDQSDLWAVLEEIIQIGGIFHTEEQMFTAPYTYRNFPDDLDPFVHVVVIDKDVKVYEKEDLESDVVAYLNYNIIQVDESETDYWNNPDQDLIKIETPSGKEGYIQKQSIRSPIDYRLAFVRKGDEWKLAFLVAGD